MPLSRDHQIVAFDNELLIRSDAVYRAHRDLFADHRDGHPWVTGQLGDPWAPVWFIAESPSLGQVKRVMREPTKNTQWNISNADALFRRMLVEHGFKDPPSEASDGWGCYITDVIKSAEQAKAMGSRSQASRNEVAKAWAPVLRWELEHCTPQLVVTVGLSADRLFKRLINNGDIDYQGPLGFVTHYTGIARYPDHKGRRAMHPDRVAEYAQQFQRVSDLAQTLVTH